MEARLAMSIVHPADVHESVAKQAGRQKGSCAPEEVQQSVVGVVLMLAATLLCQLSAQVDSQSAVSAVLIVTMARELQEPRAVVRFVLGPDLALSLVQADR